MTQTPVYLDHAATTPVRAEVLEAMLPFLGPDAFGNPASAHRFGRTARAGVEEARRQVAVAVGAEPSQVIFTSGGTEADNLAVVGASLAAGAAGRPMHAAVCATDHKAVLEAAHAVARLGGSETVLPVDSHGLLEMAALDAALAADPAGGVGHVGQQRGGDHSAGRGDRPPVSRRRHDVPYRRGAGVR